MRVGMIGLGAMGQPMAHHLLRAGHDLGVWARRPQAAQSLVAAGALLCTTPAELARHAEVVLTVVTAGDDVASLVFGAQGLLEGFTAGSLLVDCSTIAPQQARALAGQLADHGVDMLDAPVSGGAQGASAATLVFMVGGQASALERARPLFEVLGKRVVHVGGSGAGQVAKACNQMVMVAAIEALAEALHLAGAAGVDAAKVRQALAGGSAGSRVLEVMGERMVTRNFSAGVEARLHHKDYGILMAEACRLAIPLPLSAQVWQQLNALMASGWGHDDTASLLRVLALNRESAVDRSLILGKADE